MAHEHAVNMLLVEAAALSADEAGLRRYAPRPEELSARDGHPLYLAIAHRGWGVAHRLAGERDQAEARLQQALELFEALAAGWQVGRTLFELAELERARSDRRAARQRLTRALEAFGSLGAAPDVERTKKALESVS
jgi:tetratricopeptide (TPR) repeat protein